LHIVPFEQMTVEGFDENVNITFRGAVVGSPFLVRLKSRIFFHCTCINSTCWA
jgi:hypothetical protein